MAWVKAGSLAAFGELYDRYCDRAYRVASSICRGEGDAHEAVREAFVSIWRGRASFGAQTGTAAPWVMVLTRRCALEIADNHRPVAAPRDGESTPPTSRAASKIAEHVAKRVQARDLRSLLAALPDRQREVITLAFYGELTYTQIAAHLDLPAGAVKGRMRMGLQRLRADIQRVAS